MKKTSLIALLPELPVIFVDRGPYPLGLQLLGCGKGGKQGHVRAVQHCQCRGGEQDTGAQPPGLSLGRASLLEICVLSSAQTFNDI